MSQNQPELKLNPKNFLTYAELPPEEQTHYCHLAAEMKRKGELVHASSSFARQVIDPDPVYVDFAKPA